MRLFASLRFTQGGPFKQAEALQRALAPHGVELMVVDTRVGGNIEERVFTTMDTCAGFVAFGDETKTNSTQYIKLITHHNPTHRL